MAPLSHTHSLNSSAVSPSHRVLAFVNLLRFLPSFPLILTLLKSQNLRVTVSLLWPLNKAAWPWGIPPSSLSSPHSKEQCQPRVLLAKWRRDNRGQQCYFYHFVLTYNITLKFSQSIKMCEVHTVCQTLTVDATVNKRAHSCSQ